MSSKNLTYYQFKKIAGSLGDDIKDPEQIMQASGITDLDYDLMHEYLTKWNAEKEAIKSLQTSENEIKDLNNNQDSSLVTNNEEINLKDSSLALFRSTLESSKDGIIIVDNDGRLIDWNEKFFEVAEIPKDALEEGSEEVGLGYVFDNVKDPEKLIFELAEIEQQNSFKGDYGIVEYKNGRILERYTQPLIQNDKQIGRVWSFKDITVEKQQQDRINILTGAIQSATQGIIVLDEDKIVYINEYLNQQLGFKDCNIDNIVDHTIAELSNNKLDILYKKICKEISSKSIINNEGQVARSLPSDIYTILEKNNVSKNQFVLTSKEGSKWYELDTFETEYEDKKYILGIISDITTSKELQDQLEYNAYHDILTGLPNRNSLIKIMNDKIINKDQFAISYIDLDNFKLINDSLGHHIGDIMIKNIGKKLNSLFNKIGIVGRMGGDEYVIILNNINNKDKAVSAVERIKELTSHPVKVEDYEFNITLTMGVALYPYDAATPIELLKNADTAMYQKKNQGKNGIGFYDSTMKTKNMRKISIANKIYKAIENEELSLHYQPIIDLKTHKITSVEALIRWNNEELGGFVPPDEFISVTEEVGYIDTLTYWVFENALNQLKRWHTQGYSDLRQTLNLSGALLYNPSIIDNIYKIIKTCGVAPEMVTLELTENVFINNSNDVVKMLNRFKDVGLKIAIDDFGTGYSSYAYLQQLPIDVIKIDKAFTQALVDNTHNDSQYPVGFIQNRAIVLSIIELGKHAGYDIVAEGVETINQMNFLNQHKCKYGQGYYFSRPVPAKDIENLLHENRLSGK